MPREVTDTFAVYPVADVTSDGRISEATFRFQKPLEDTTYEWLLWDPSTSSYYPAELPHVGETRVY